MSSAMPSTIAPHYIGINEGRRGRGNSLSRGLAAVVGGLGGRLGGLVDGALLLADNLDAALLSGDDTEGLSTSSTLSISDLSHRAHTRVHRRSVDRGLALPHRTLLLTKPAYCYYIRVSH